MEIVPNIGISDFKIFDGQLFYLKRYYAEMPEDLQVHLLSFNLSSGITEKIHEFNRGVDCEKFDVIDKGKFVALLDHHRNNHQIDGELKIGDLSIGLSLSNEVKLLIRDE